MLTHQLSCNMQSAVQDSVTCWCMGARSHGSETGPLESFCDVVTIHAVRIADSGSAFHSSRTKTPGVRFWILRSLPGALECRDTAWIQGIGEGRKRGGTCNMVRDFVWCILLSVCAGDCLPAGSGPFRLHGHGLGAAGGHLPHMTTEHNCF